MEMCLSPESGSQQGNRVMANSTLVLKPFGPLYHLAALDGQVLHWEAEAEANIDDFHGSQVPATTMLFSVYCSCLHHLIQKLLLGIKVRDLKAV